MRREIKLMWDYGCSPLWHYGGAEVGNIDPDSLPISTVTKARLEAWASIPDDKLDRSYPPDTNWTEEETHAFEAEGKELWHILQRELGDVYRIVYYSSAQHKVLILEGDRTS